MLGAVKDHLDNEDDDEIAPGVSKFSVTRWTVRATCFRRIFINYRSLQETWKECLKQVGVYTEIKSRIIGCQMQILGERLFSHTDNLSATLQNKEMASV